MSIAIPQYRTIKSLELIGDYAELLLDLEKMSEPERKELSTHGKEILSILEEITKEFLKKDTSNIDTLFRKMKSILQEITQIKLAGKSSGFIEGTFILKNIVSICRDLAEITLNAEKVDEMAGKPTA
jgi:hypothetical protein